MPTLVQTATRGRIRVLTIDNPPVNALAAAAADTLMAAIEEAQADAAVAGIAIAGAGRVFCGGADIRAFEAAALDPSVAVLDLRPLMRSVESSLKPVVVAIHGVALGGGLELAMAGHFRIAAADARLGLPECSIGLIPGAEGTQRLPRLAGVEMALTMIVSGQPITSAEARQHGIIDRVIEGNLIDAAVAFAEQTVETGAPLPKTSERHDKLGTPETNAPLYAAARVRAETIRPGQSAPLRAITAVESATRLPFDAGSGYEAVLFRECVRSDEARTMIAKFFAERARKHSK